MSNSISTPDNGRLSIPASQSEANRSRRVFLQRLAVLGAASASGTLLAGCTKSSDSQAQTGIGGSDNAAEELATGVLTANHVDGRVLVIVNLEGGNDGPSTVVPAGSSAYYSARPRLAIEEGEVLTVNDRIGLNPNLARLHERGVTIIEGVGPSEGDLSHFAMAERWALGDVNGTAKFRTGFGGRLTDALHQGSPVTGITMSGSSPFLYSQTAPGLALSGPGDLDFLRPADWDELLAFQEALGSFGEGLVPDAYEQLLDLGQRLASVEEQEIDWEHPIIQEGGSLGQQLWGASDIIKADLGTRVIYTEIGGFDTHEGHEYQHGALLSRMDAAIDGFLELAEEGGFADRVVIATTSEFGRRLRENDGGLDHGSASTMLVAGAIEPQILGEPSDLDDLDDDGNLRVTVGFDRYLGSLAEEWLGVEAASVLASEPELLGLV